MSEQRTSLRLAIVFAFFIFAYVTPATAQINIDWNVANRFRLFKSPPSPVGPVEEEKVSPSDILLLGLSIELDLWGGDFKSYYANGDNCSKNQSEFCTRTDNEILQLYKEIYQFNSGRIVDSDDVFPEPGELPYINTRWTGYGPLTEGNPYGTKGYQRKYDDDYLYPKDYTVRLWAAGTVESDRCAWEIIYPQKPPIHLENQCAHAVLAPEKAIQAPDEVKAYSPENVTTIGPPDFYRNEGYGAIPYDARLQSNWDYRSSPMTVHLTVRHVDGSSEIIEPVTIEFPDRLILGMGDSFASGEGNPDKPETFPATFTDAVKSYWHGSAPDDNQAKVGLNRIAADPYERWWLQKPVLDTIQMAQWWDPVCHRSLYGQQIDAAVFYSAMHPHEAVTFASFSCSGAKVVEGLLASQVNPPGVSDFGGPYGGSAFSDVPQVEAAMSLLCMNHLRANEHWDFSNLAMRTTASRAEIANAAKNGSARNASCDIPDQPGFVPRKPTALLISIGGNDIGFAGAIKDALLPSQAENVVGMTALDISRTALGVTPTWLAMRKIRFDLPVLYPTLHNVLRVSLLKDGQPVIQTLYPNPLNNQNGELCHTTHDNLLFSSMQGIFPDANFTPSHRWRLEIDQKEEEDLREGIINPLNAEIAGGTLQTAKANFWYFASYGPAFDKHGWCAGSDEEQFDFPFPALTDEYTFTNDNWQYHNSNWSPFDPTAWDAYFPRERWFRTANDVFLTQIGSPKSKYFGLVSRAIFASSGIAHPTAQGHMAMGLSAAFALDAALAPAPEVDVFELLDQEGKLEKHQVGTGPN